MRLFLFSMIVSAILVGSVAFGAEVNVESLQGRTQIDGAGYLNYSTDSRFFWLAQGSAFHYVTPQLGFGGSVVLNGATDSTLSYSVGPAVEYFIPFADRHHVFAQGLLGVSGSSATNSAQHTQTYLSMTATAGYRYFVTNDIAIGARLVQSWQKNVSRSGSLDRTGGVSLLFGFSLFF